MTLHARTSMAIVAFASAGIFALPVAAEEMKFMAELSGEAQVPPVETEAMGMADVTVDTEALTVTWRLTHEGLSGEPVAAHFHGPATPEETAPPVIDMGEGAYGATVDVEAAEGTDGAEAEVADETAAEEADEAVAESIMEGSAELTEEQLADLQAGRYYINVHTEQHPDGEIRGQVVEGEAEMEAMEGGAPGGTAQDAASGEATEGAEAGAMPADLAAGESIFQESCRNCHGPRAQGMASFPRLAGQDAEYLLGRLHQYHAGEKVGPGSALMIPIAQDLSEEDMTNVAAYIASAFE